MFKILEQGDLSDGRTRCAFLVFQPDFFEGHEVIREPRLALEDRGVGALKIRK